MKALLSDIHANLEALRAVLDDAMRQGAEEIYCLGDLVGYGPDPRECLDLVIDLEISLVLRGNHDEGVLREPTDFAKAAERALLWTRKQLDGSGEEPEVAERRRRFLEELPLKHQEGDLLFVHASPRDPLNEYIRPDQARDPVQMSVHFWMVERCCFMGHTHIPGIFTNDFHFQAAGTIDGPYRLQGSKVLCNVGSVGQPRDRDKRACYVLFDGETIRFRRVEYDIAATRKKVRALRDLDWSYWK
jgi:diadenosine tetraphosphatase ApaH/serine/threonine PP2A family protein phosphatase